jgi:hypothetical protein
LAPGDIQGVEYVGGIARAIPMTESLVYICEICQTPLEDHHCTSVCPNCGRTLDCTDLPFIAASAKRMDDERLVVRPGADPVDLLPPLDHARAA